MNSIYAIVPLAGAVFAVALGSFVLTRYFKEKKEIHLVLALFCYSVTVWLFGTYMMFTSTQDSQAIFWDRLVYSGVVFIPVLMHHFSIVFADKPKQRKYLIYGYLSAFIFFFLSFTNYFVADLYHYKWGVHTKAQFFHHIFILSFFTYVSIFFINVLKYYKKTTNPVLKNQARYVFAAFLVLILLGAPAYLPAYGISVPPFPFLSGLFFILILSYSILKHKLLDVKVAGTVFFTVALMILLFIDIFLAKSKTEEFFRIVAFLVGVGISYVLIKSVQQEIIQKEKNASLAVRLEEANTNLKELDKTKDDFLSMASHELNTPIAAIEGYLSMILVEGLGGKIPDKARKYLDSVFQSSQRLAHLVKDLLNVSRIESDRIHIIYEESQIIDLINQAVMEIGSKVQEKHHTLTFKQAKAKMPTTWLDKTRITEVLINIIGNSVKYTPENGAIDIKVVHDDDKLVISVADNGKGIPNDRNAAVFEKFTQVDVLKDEVKGTGLGMYISKRFIELHKGKIWFHSDGAGKGTTFFFSLPIYAKKPYDPFAGEGSVLH